MWRLLLVYAGTLCALEEPFTHHQQWKRDLIAGSDMLGVAHHALNTHSFTIAVDALEAHTALMNKIAHTYIISDQYRCALLLRSMEQEKIIKKVKQLENREFTHFTTYKHNKLVRELEDLHARVPDVPSRNIPDRLAQTIRCLLLPPERVTTIQNLLWSASSGVSWLERKAHMVENRAPDIAETVETVVNPPLSPLALSWLQSVLQYAPGIVRDGIVAYDPVNLGPLNHLVQQHVPVSEYVQHFQGFLTILGIKDQARSIAGRLPYTLPHRAQQLQSVARMTRTVLTRTQDFVDTHLTYRPYGQAAETILHAWSERMMDMVLARAEPCHVGLGLLLEEPVPGIMTRASQTLLESNQSV